jgi:hypothetical protein
MYSYETVSEAVRDLSNRGYKYNFNLQNDLVLNKELDLSLSPENFKIVETYRFEGMSDPSDEEVVYAIESKDGIKGVLVNAFGIYADGLSAEMVKKFGSA